MAFIKLVSVTAGGTQKRYDNSIQSEQNTINWKSGVLGTKNKMKNKITVSRVSVMNINDNMTANTNFNATSRALKVLQMIAITLGCALCKNKYKCLNYQAGTSKSCEVNLLDTVSVLKILLTKTGRYFSVLLVGPCYEILVTAKKKVDYLTVELESIRVELNITCRTCLVKMAMSCLKEHTTLPRE